MNELFKKNGENEWWFQQDGDSKHTSKVVQDWLQLHVPHFVKKDEWPTNSSDINLIENLWKQMDDAVKARYATTLKSLKRIIKDKWKKISLENIQNLYKSYPSRLKQIVERNGGMSDY